MKMIGRPFNEPQLAAATVYESLGTNRMVNAFSNEGSKQGVGVVNNPRIRDFAESVGIVSKGEKADSLSQLPEKLRVLDPWSRCILRSPGVSVVAA